MRCIRLSRSISAAAASTTVTAYWVHMSQKWALNHAAKCIHLQLVKPIRVLPQTFIENILVRQVLVCPAH